ncbi:protein FAM227B isoform X2 [Podarcis raffonei]|uniref:protein FAM227B isoform X2 n=1 Tax=Podarcis raffonei TaxID=65483 RepID=UPI0023290AA4|nr:protein FAM227B isoform X2 [Podarcis raffonei]
MAASESSTAATKAVPQPPRTFEEFLVSQKLDDWPRFPYMPEMDTQPLVAKLKKDYALETITKCLHDNAPISTKIISDLEKRMDECKMRVHEHADVVLYLESKESEKDDQEGVFIEQDTCLSESTSSLPRKKKKKKKVQIAADTIDHTSSKRVENYKFPGFKPMKVMKLPNHLEPAQLWDSVLKVQTFKGVDTKILKKLFISEASLAILQDCFWWWFLHKFKPDQAEQDHLFDRISDSFVALLLSTPSFIKDPFFQMYPDCLSQAIYVTFCEAFPESRLRFTDEFKEELMDLVFQWIRGFKPQKSAWKKWNLFWLEAPLTQTQKTDSLHKLSSLKLQNSVIKTRSIGKSWSRSPIADQPQVHFQLEKEEPKEVEVTPKKKAESHYIGDGPDFQRSLFNLGGQSPLVVYYLKMHGISNTLANMRAYRINHIEICKVPPASPTYRDAIAESQKIAEKRHNDFLNFEHKCADELAHLQRQRKKVNRTYKRMLATITKKRTESRLQTESFISQRETPKPCHSTSTPASTSTSTVSSAAEDLP